jgi:hypothetical protein
LRTRLRIDLAIALDNDAVKAAVHIRIPRRTMIVIAERSRLMAVESIEFFRLRAIGLCDPINWIPIEGEGDGQARVDCFLQMKGRGVIMIVIRATTVAAPLVELANFPARARRDCSAG